MKDGEVPWFLMWCSALLFAFGIVWAWLVNIAVAMTVTVLDIPAHAAILIGAGAVGTLLGQFSMLLTWRRYVRATEDDLRPVVRSTQRSGTARDDEPSHEVEKKRIEERA